MIGVMHNAIEETRLRRVNDRTRPDHAVREKDRAVLVKPGEVSLLIPDQDEIHQLDNPSDRTTVGIGYSGPRHDSRIWCAESQAAAHSRAAAIRLRYAFPKHAESTRFAILEWSVLIADIARQQPEGRG
jgi:hypothetical protein